jgi:hypothetical protein
MNLKQKNADYEIPHRAAGRGSRWRDRLFCQPLGPSPLLYWDDLGQTHLTGAASEMLLHLIEERTTAARPILATTQYSGERLEAQFERPDAFP